MGKFDRKLRNEVETKKKKKINPEIFDRKNESSRNKRILDNVTAK
jgi:hypothetical protein